MYTHTHHIILTGTHTHTRARVRAHTHFTHPVVRPSNAPDGLYLHGGVGTGKTFVMDLFFDAAPVTAKRRVHFHEFMLDVHAR